MNVKRLEVPGSNIQSTPLLWPLLIMLSFALTLLFVGIDNNTLEAQKQNQTLQLTRQGFPISIIPSLSGNILGMVSFLLGTSSFVLGQRIYSARTASTSSTSPPSSTPTLAASILDKYFEILILALVVPALAINVYGILLVGTHLYVEDAPYFLLLCAPFIPTGAILFLLGKLRALR
jgi:hypothetical protein